MPIAMEKWVLGKSNKTFLHFFAIFDDFSKFSRNLGIIKKMVKVWQKNEEKTFSTCLKTHFSTLLQVPKTWVLGTHTNTNHHQIIMGFFGEKKIILTPINAMVCPEVEQII